MKRTFTPMLLALLLVGALFAAACTTSENQAADSESTEDGSTVAVADREASTDGDSDPSGGDASSSDATGDDSSQDASSDGDSDDANSGGGASGSVDGTLVTYVSSAMERTAAYDSYDFSLELVMTGLPDLAQPMVLAADGSFDAPNERMYMSMDMSAMFEALAGDVSEEEMALMSALLGDGVMEFLVDGRDVYISWSLFSALFGAETKWVKFTDDSGTDLMGDLGSFGGLDLGQVGTGPAGMLELYSGLGDVQVLGSATIRGVATTGYEVVLDVDRALELVDADERAAVEGSLGGIDELPLAIWVDEDDLLRRFEMYMDGDVLGEPGASVTIRYDLFNFGDAVGIHVPSGDEVTELDGESLFGGF